MNIVIAGAGELGQLLAKKLTANDHNVSMIDSSPDVLDNIPESLEVNLHSGSCIDPDILTKAGIRNADVLLAVSGDTATNVLACQIASRLGTPRTICRISDTSLFSSDKQLTPDSFCIWKYVSPPEECARKIEAVIGNRFLLEEIRFSHSDAVMQVLKIGPSFPLANARIKDMPIDSGLRDSIRFAAIIKGKEIVIPHGDTIFVPGDKVYVAGTSENVREFIRQATSDQPGAAASRVIISGASEIGVRLADMLASSGYDVRFIEKNPNTAEQLSDLVPPSVLVINGNPTDEEILKEAGAGGCDAFISVDEDEEDNILSCVIAKKMGALKTISVTSKPEYILIVPRMDGIDCGISSSLVAVNAVLRMLETGTMRVDAYLDQYRAQLTEFRISNSSPLCGRSLATCKLPASTLFALMFRDQEVITPSGSTIFRPGDIVVAIVKEESKDELDPLFPDR